VLEDSLENDESGETVDTFSELTFTVESKPTEKDALQENQASLVEGDHN
jgi:hypothetical protein